MGDGIGLDGPDPAEPGGPERCIYRVRSLNRNVTFGLHKTIKNEEHTQHKKKKEIEIEIENEIEIGNDNEIPDS